MEIRLILFLFFGCSAIEALSFACRHAAPDFVEEIRKEDDVVRCFELRRNVGGNIMTRLDHGTASYHHGPRWLTRSVASGRRQWPQPRLIAAMLAGGEEDIHGDQNHRESARAGYRRTR